MPSPLQLSDLDDLPPGETVEVADGARLERRGNAVDWRGPDGRLLAVGHTATPTAHWPR